MVPEVSFGLEDGVDGQPVAQPFVELRFEQGLRNGLIHLEIVRGGMISAVKVFCWPLCNLMAKLHASGHCWPPALQQPITIDQFD